MISRINIDYTVSVSPCLPKSVQKIFNSNISLSTNGQAIAARDLWQWWSVQRRHCPRYSSPVYRGRSYLWEHWGGAATGATQCWASCWSAGWASEWEVARTCQHRWLGSSECDSEGEWPGQTCGWPGQRGLGRWPVARD